MSGWNGRLNEDIRDVRIGLERFAAAQTGPAVLFFLACLEYRLTSAAERYADPEFRNIWQRGPSSRSHARRSQKDSG